jgi:hypothetical protein
MNKYRNILSAGKNYAENLDALFFNKKDWADVNAVIVVSTGRTGTKFIAHYFQKYIENFFSLHEGFPKLDILASRYFTEKLSYSKTKDKVKWRRKFSQRELYKNQKNCYLESNPGFWSLLPILNDIMPNLKIIYVVRDGRTWLRSVYSRKIDKRGNLKKDRHGLVWKFTADDKKVDEYYGLWNKMNIIEKLAWTWKIKNETIYKSIKNNSNAITVKFEDIFHAEKNYNGLQEIINFISNDYPVKLNLNDITSPLKEKVNKTPDFLLPKYENWSEGQKDGFKRIAGNFMSKMNYL